jgi:hypothetical protein
LGSNRTERSIADVHAPLGIATTRVTDRAAAAVGLLQQAEPIFTHANNVCNAGVLFLVPALISQGLLKATDIYTQLRKGYYGLVSILLVLSFMFLSRIKCPEQLKTCKVGELGRVLGLDRVPEAKCLRSKIEQLVNQHKAEEFNQVLSRQWIEKEEPMFFYIDGHVRVYHGHLAILPKRYVSREKLCLAGTTEFWINNELGMPYMVVTGELNEKFKDILLTQVLPILLHDTASLINEEQLKQDKDLARFIIVFDREGYDLPFFKLLWDTYRIAVLTYRKAVKDKWPSPDFHDCTTTVIGKEVSMALCEKTWQHDGMNIREIRKRSEDGHQTSIITTMRKASMELLAGKMFSRWSQENFFRYMVQDYGLDQMAEYGVEEVDQEERVVNPHYKILTYRIKKLREKAARLKAKLFTRIEADLEKDIDKVRAHLEQQSTVQEALTSYGNEIEQLCKGRKATPYYIKVKDMPEGARYNKLKTESKLFLNAIRMISYRAETAVANMLAPHYRKSNEEIRMIVKEIIASDADLVPDYGNKKLCVRLHSLSTPRANDAVKELCAMLNETETPYPGTNLQIQYEMV